MLPPPPPGTEAAASSLPSQPQFPQEALHPSRAGGPFSSVTAPFISSMVPGSVFRSSLLLLGVLTAEVFSAP